MKTKKETICNAVMAIESEWTLNQIALLIHNITNAKLNGHSKDERASEIVNDIIDRKE